ncbi:Nitroreductase [Granulicella sibirica]|uniref:Nitroreductase n=1 Tax=Granulicella sibirica TaxID=2479048 RepID=A0A4Q0T019_9BACT|nr:Nitroreductase [Granulicella sibirica]
MLLLSIAKNVFAASGQPNTSAMHDLGAATAHISLQATALGLHTHSMAGFDKDKARSSFAIPMDYDIGIVTALGYLGDPQDLPEKMRGPELAARGRKELADFVITAWAEPWKTS